MVFAGHERPDREQIKDPLTGTTRLGAPVDAGDGDDDALGVDRIVRR